MISSSVLNNIFNKINDRCNAIPFKKVQSINSTFIVALSEFHLMLTCIHQT